MKLDFKPTKWKIKYCQDCKDIQDPRFYGCLINHKIDEIENVPFYLPNLKIDKIGYKGWVYLDDPTGRFKCGFQISPSNLEKIILERGIESGGRLDKSWWMWAKVGSSHSLKWVRVIDDNNG